MSLTVFEAAESTDLVTLAFVKSVLGITDSASDTLLEFYISSASGAIAEYCDRVFARETVIEKLPGNNRTTLLLERTPIVEIVSVSFMDSEFATVAASGIEIADYNVGKLYRLDSFVGFNAVSNGIVLGPSPQRGEQVWEIKYKGGYALPSFAAYDSLLPKLPKGIESACLETVVAWWKAKDRDPELSSEKIADIYSASYKGLGDSKGEGVGVNTNKIPATALGLLNRWIRMV